MTEIVKPGVLEVDQRITAHSNYWAGQAGSAFYRALRDEGRILASRCRHCERVHWPPRTTCPRCFAVLPLSEMVPVGPGGVMETFTVLAYREPVHPTHEPLMYGVVRLDGADGAMPHLLGEVDPDRLAVGMRVTAVLAGERRGDILDILYFKPEI